jgi:hypothetical protein
VSFEEQVFLLDGRRILGYDDCSHFWFKPPVKTKQFKTIQFKTILLAVKIGSCNLATRFKKPSHSRAVQAIPAKNEKKAFGKAVLNPAAEKLFFTNIF